jgi:hypothetical protein
MTKRSNTIVNRAAAFLAENGEVTPQELNDYLAVGKYASKYVLYMKIAGHQVNTVKNGKTVLKYVYVSGPDVEVAPAPVAKPAPVKTKVGKPVKVKPAPVKTKLGKPVKVKPAKTIVIEDDVPVMDHSRKSRRNVDSVEAVFGSTGNVGSYSVDRDWDEVPSSFSRRDLGL